MKLHKTKNIQDPDPDPVPAGSQLKKKDPVPAGY